MGRAKKCMKHRKNCQAGTLLGSETDLVFGKFCSLSFFPSLLQCCCSHVTFHHISTLHKERGVPRCFRFFFGEGCSLYKDPMYNALTDMYVRTAMRY